MQAANKAENNHMAKLARHAIAKSHLDISALNIICSSSYIQLTGHVKTPAGFTRTLNVRQEIEALKNLIMTVRGVREVQSNLVTFS